MTTVKQEMNRLRYEAVLNWECAKIAEVATDILECCDPNLEQVKKIQEAADIICRAIDHLWSKPEKQEEQREGLPCHFHKCRGNLEKNHPKFERAPTPFGNDSGEHGRIVYKLVCSECGREPVR